MNHPVRMIRPRRRLYFGWYCVILILPLSATVLGWKAVSIQASLDKAILRNGELIRKRTAPRKQESREQVEAERRWLTLQEERAFPWGQIFRAVERANDPEIELLAFHPDRRQATVNLKGEGKTEASVVRYLELLQEEPNFSQVYLSHSVDSERGRLLTRAFEIQIKLKAPTPKLTK